MNPTKKENDHRNKVISFYKNEFDNFIFLRQYNKKIIGIVTKRYLGTRLVIVDGINPINWLIVYTDKTWACDYYVNQQCAQWISKNIDKIVLILERVYCIVSKNSKIINFNCLLSEKEICHFWYNVVVNSSIENNHTIIDLRHNEYKAVSETELEMI